MRKRRSFLLAATALAAFSFTAPARANEVWGDGVQVMDDAAMAGLRGGVRLPNGFDIGFGAVVTTYAHGVPALETRLTWTTAGAIVTETTGDIGTKLSSLTPEERATLGLSGLDGLGGVVISDAEGVTALAHNITKGALQNIIINNASGRDLTQTVDVTITLPAFEGMQQALDIERLGMSLGVDIRDQLAGAGR